MQIKFIAAIIIFGMTLSCGSSTDKTTEKHRKTVLSIPEDVTLVVGIGKVESRNGLIKLASDASGIVQSVKKYTGDSVRRGDAILTLHMKNKALQVEQSKNRIITQKKKINAGESLIKRFKVQLNSKIEELKISKNLAGSGAETRENIRDLNTEKAVLKTQLTNAKLEVAVKKAELQELQTELQLARAAFQERTITAPVDGVILEINVRKGEAIRALETYATLVPDEPLVVHGEADEMFSNLLKIGQFVKVHHIGSTHTITTGKIIALAPGLNNKSIFTGSPGEQQDRRVRKFKVLLDSIDNLLINSKVSCDIYIK